MELKNIKILNFRSILNQEIDFTDQCIGLIGLNESGKTNILKSIRALDENFSLTYLDRSKISGKLPTIEYCFQLTKDEISQVRAKVSSIISEVIINNDHIDFSFTDITSIKRVIKVIRVEEAIKKESSFDYSLNINFNSEILILSDQTLGNDAVIEFDDKKIQLNEVEFILSDLIPEEYLNSFEEFDKQTIFEKVKDGLDSYFSELLPEIIYWEYQSKYLLPSEITYDQLILNDNPYENSAPLYNIFLLSKALEISSIDDLKLKIAIWKSDSSERRKDSSIITDSINEYVKSIWADYDQDLKIELEENKITIHINDPKSLQKNFYEMEARSQGFKTFISFILTIAAEVETGNTSNFILLLDEPETHLHPSGVRYMMQELLKLAHNKNNIILYATHSLFMIDRSYLKRHIIVSKQNELTHLKRVDRNNFIQEAVIYEALGTHLDEFAIGLKNIVFEGELDLKIFSFLFEKCVKDEDAKNLLDYNFWDGGGTKRIDQFLNNKILPNKSEWIIILDNDNPGKELAKTISSKFDNTQNVKVKTVHYSKVPNFELEDILPKKIIQKAFDEAIKKLNIATSHLVDFSKETKAVSAAINEFKNKNKLNAEQQNLFEEYFKQALDYETIDALTSIDQKTEIDDKLNEFKINFEAYYDFASDFVDKFFKAIKGLFKPSDQTTQT